MNSNLPEVERFEIKFEGIDIHVHKLDIEIIHEVNPEMFILNTPYTGIWHDTSVHKSFDSKDIVGKVFIIFRDQNDYKMALWLETTITVRAAADTLSANTFCKLTQYLFIWLNEYVKANEIKNAKEQLFLMPDFGYSESHFQYAFPD